MADLKTLNIGAPPTGTVNEASHADTIGEMIVHGPLVAHSFETSDGQNLLDDMHYQYQWDIVESVLQEEVLDADGNVTQEKEIGYSVEQKEDSEELVNAQALFDALFEKAKLLENEVGLLKNRAADIEAINNQQQINIDELKEKDTEHDTRIEILENLVKDGDEPVQVSDFAKLLDYLHIEEDESDTTYNEHLRIARDDADNIIINNNGISMGAQTCVEPIDVDDMEVSQLMTIGQKAALAMGNYGFTIDASGAVNFGKYTAVKAADEGEGSE